MTHRARHSGVMSRINVLLASVCLIFSQKVLAGRLLVRGNRGLLGLDYEEVDENARDHDADNRPGRQRWTVFGL
jgi:hypothetical protein